MLTFKTLTTATVLGTLLVALLVCLLGQSQGVTFSHETARVLVGVRPF